MNVAACADFMKVLQFHGSRAEIAAPCSKKSVSGFIFCLIWGLST